VSGSLLCADASIGQHAVLEGSLVGSGARVAPRTTLSGAVIGPPAPDGSTVEDSAQDVAEGR
jgi:hypothetical protein